MSLSGTIWIQSPVPLKASKGREKKKLWLWFYVPMYIFVEYGKFNKIIGIFANESLTDPE